MRRVAFALRFGDINPLISNLVTPESRAIYVRDIGERVRKAAPFLRYDPTPTRCVIDGRIMWIQDAYTTTSPLPLLPAGRHASGSRAAAGCDVGSTTCATR